MQIHNCEQYSEEWWALRAGRFTASQASKLLTPTGKLSTQYKPELGRLIAEKMGLQEADRSELSTEWMDRGSEMEDEALAWLIVDRDFEAERVGIITEGELIGASPDAISTEDGIDVVIPIEIKVPKPSTHIQWLMEGGLPKQHRAQLHFQMAVTNSPVGYFMSYHPELEPIVVCERYDDYTAAMREAIDTFKQDYADAYLQITGKEL